MRLTRRTFCHLSALGGMAWLGEAREPEEVSCPPAKTISAAIPETVRNQEKRQISQDKIARVAVIKTSDRAMGIARAVALLEAMDFSGATVYLKGSYNSPDPFPATTHPDSLRALVRLLASKGAKTVTLIERSGMGRTRDVWAKLDVPRIARELGMELIPLDELPATAWRQMKLPESHWTKGIAIPYFLRQDNCVVQLCNLKTHRFGGEFSASLKNSVGLIAKYADIQVHNATTATAPWNYMRELHASSLQGSMIAEINQAYTPSLVVMDAVEVFIAGGPEWGERSAPGIIAAARDRVALDALGVAILIFAGARINDGVFAHEQIRRATELRLGIEGPGKINLISDDEPGRLLTEKLESILHK